MDARLHDGEEVVLRYFDARVFEALLQALSPTQRTAWLSPAHRWWYVDRAGLLQTRDGSPSVPEADLLTEMLQLDAAQFAALLDATEPDQVANLLRQRMPEHFLHVEPPERHAFVLRHMLQARREWRLESTNDLAIYCGLALLYGEDFATRPAWQQALPRVAAGDLKLAQAVAQVENEERR